MHHSTSKSIIIISYKDFIHKFCNSMWIYHLCLQMERSDATTFMETEMEEQPTHESNPEDETSQSTLGMDGFEVLHGERGITSSIVHQS